VIRARDNPFRTDRILQVRYELDGISWDELMIRLERKRYRGALFGPHGSGKTTLLEDLGMRLREVGLSTHWLRLDEENRAFQDGYLDELFAQLSNRDILLFDGAEQLNALTWQRFKRRATKAGGLIITTHRPGRLPTLHECSTSAALLASIIARLTGSDPVQKQSLAEELFERHRGNLRNALRECYDLASAGQAIPCG
jgi:hypothetical protein